MRSHECKVNNKMSCSSTDCLIYTNSLSCTIQLNTVIMQVSTTQVPLPKTGRDQIVHMVERISTEMEAMGKVGNSLKKKKESLRSLGVDLQLCFGPFPTGASVKEYADKCQGRRDCGDSMLESVLIVWNS